MRALRALLGSNRVMLAAAVAVLGMQSPGVQAQSPDVFTHEIRPIMERTCWNCHSDQIQSSGLNLSTREGALQGGSRGPAIVPGQAEESRLYRQLAGIEGPLMPLGVPLSADEIEAVRNWINAGAQWDSGPTTVAGGDDFSAFVTDVPDSAREYWAFKLPVQSPLPDIAGFDHPIDRFLEEKRQTSGVTPAPQADQSTLLRRAFLDSNFRTRAAGRWISFANCVC